MTDKTISFISDRKHYIIPISDILYVLMKKQDAYVHVSDGSVLKTRMTLQHREEIMIPFHRKQRVIIDELSDNDNPT